MKSYPAILFCLLAVAACALAASAHGAAGAGAASAGAGASSPAPIARPASPAPAAAAPAGPAPARSIALPGGGRLSVLTPRVVRLELGGTTYGPTITFPHRESQPVPSYTHTLTASRLL